MGNSDNRDGIQKSVALCGLSHLILSPIFIPTCLFPLNHRFQSLFLFPFRPPPSVPAYSFPVQAKIMDQQDAPADSLIQRLDFRNECIRSLLREGRTMKARVKCLEEEGKEMTQLKSENDALKARLTEFRELSIKMNLLEEKIQGMVDAENKELRGKLVKKAVKTRELKVRISGMERLEGARGEAIDALKRRIQCLESGTQEIPVSGSEGTDDGDREPRNQNGNLHENLTNIAKGIQQSLQQIDDSNKVLAERLEDSSKKMAGRLGIESVYAIIIFWVLNKIWDWISAYLANFAANRTSNSMDDQNQV